MSEIVSIIANETIEEVSISVNEITEQIAIAVTESVEQIELTVSDNVTVLVPAAFEQRVADLEKTGWIYFINTTHTELSPFVFQDGVEFVFPLRDDASLDSNSPDGLLTFIDNSNNKLIPPNEGDELELRVEFFMKTDLADRKGSFNIDIGVVPRFNPRKFSGSDNASIPELISVDFPMFIGSTFIVNGGELKCTIDGNGSVYDVSAYVRKIRHGEDI